MGRGFAAGGLPFFVCELRLVLSDRRNRKTSTMFRNRTLARGPEPPYGSVRDWPGELMVARSIDLKL